MTLNSAVKNVTCPKALKLEKVGERNGRSQSTTLIQVVALLHLEYWEKATVRVERKWK